MSNFGNYEERIKNFSWSLSEQELGYQPGQPINIGYYCSDRVCQQGKADRLALIWEGFSGEKKIYTYDDLRRYSNTFARFLTDSGIKAGDRVCLFMDRVPELYIGFVGILKTGAIAQPLFFRFWRRFAFCQAGKCPDLGYLYSKKACGQGQENQR